LKAKEPFTPAHCIAEDFLAEAPEMPAQDSLASPYENLSGDPETEKRSKLSMAIWKWSYSISAMTATPTFMKTSRASKNRKG
jgi:hypothetical protein